MKDDSHLSDGLDDGPSLGPTPLKSIVHCVISSIICTIVYIISVENTRETDGKAKNKGYNNNRHIHHCQAKASFKSLALA